MFYVIVTGEPPKDVVTYGPIPSRAEAERWVEANKDMLAGHQVYIHAWRPFAITHELQFLRCQS